MKKILRLAKKLIILLFNYKPKKFMSIGKNVIIHKNCFLSDVNRISIGNNVYIGPSSRLFGKGEIQIGNGVVLGEEVLVFSSNHNYDSENQKTFPFDTNNIEKKVIIDDYAWIGSRAIILPGVRVGLGTVVGAGSVVTKSFDNNSILAGNPARKVGERKEKLFDNLEYLSWVEINHKKHPYKIN